MSFDLVFSRFTVLQFKTHMFILIYLKHSSFLMDYTRFVRLFINKIRFQHTRFFVNVFKCSKHAKVLSKSILCFFKCSSLMEFLANLWHWFYSLFNVECIFFSMYLFLNVFVSSSNNISSGFVCFYLVFRWLMDWFIHHKKISGNCQK